MFETSKKATEKKATNGLMIGLIACMGVIIVLLGAVVVLLLGRGNDTVVDRKEEPKRNVVVNKDNVEDVVKGMTGMQPNIPLTYNVKMNSTWYFDDGSSPSRNAYVENVTDNTTDVYFDVVLAEDESVMLLESPLLPLGSYMKDITLDVDLDAGTYDCVLIYHLVDEDQNTLSTVRMAIQIVVEG